MLYFMFNSLVCSCFAGEVELENLPFRKDALLKFDLPIEVKAGGYITSSVFHICIKISNASEKS